VCTAALFHFVFSDEITRGLHILGGAIAYMIYFVWECVESTDYFDTFKNSKLTDITWRRPYKYIQAMLYLPRPKSWLSAPEPPPSSSPLSSVSCCSLQLSGSVHDETVELPTLKLNNVEAKMKLKLNNAEAESCLKYNLLIRLLKPLVTLNLFVTSACESTLFFEFSTHPVLSNFNKFHFRCINYWILCSIILNCVYCVYCNCICIARIPRWFYDMRYAIWLSIRPGFMAQWSRRGTPS